ncbi:hypothetical protein ARMGADRAFT_1036172 [Armillaria gallica]|uniref:Uncharacterized protein n=1 Tax=Armillaria gallica TaxID=47427 RepID=A0A2H3CW91_ARMGA|nr:hypothetical protein ARMGADRAFT_1036172 [Armillaria gallica]
MVQSSTVEGDEGVVVVVVDDVDDELQGYLSRPRLPRRKHSRRNVNPAWAAQNLFNSRDTILLTYTTMQSPRATNLQTCGTAKCVKTPSLAISESYHGFIAKIPHIGSYSNLRTQWSGIDCPASSRLAFVRVVIKVSGVTWTPNRIGRIGSLWDPFCVSIMLVDSRLSILFVNGPELQIDRELWPSELDPTLPEMDG